MNYIEIENKIHEKLAEHDLTENDLTKQELAELRKEVIAEANGETILDGVFSDASIYYRNRR